MNIDQCISVKILAFILLSAYNKFRKCIGYHKIISNYKATTGQRSKEMYSSPSPKKTI